MKVSEMIKEIVAMAEEKFWRDQDHPNDCVYVSIWCDTYEGELQPWQVSLQRPTDKELDRGYVYADLIHTVKVSEEESRFVCRSETLVSALEELRLAVELADCWD